jgi:plastocyanin
MRSAGACPIPSTPVNRRQILLALPALLLALGAAATGATAASHDIAIVDYAFQPAAVTVLAGEPVTWTNGSGRDHTVTSDTGAELDSGNVGPGEAYGHVFDAPGTYAYHCEIHPDRMRGTITVLAAATLPPGTTPQPTPPAGTLPPGFSPFPSAAAESSPGPEASQGPAASGQPSGTGGGPGLVGPAAVAVLALALGGLTYLLASRRARPS